jgi:Domain of unknown function (DUF1707)
VDSSDVAFPSPSPGRRTDGPDLRASDVERDAAAAELSEHYQAGRLDQGEFDDRLTLAFQARTRGDLIHLLADLPLEPAAPALPEPEPVPAHPAVPAGYWLLPLVVPLMLVAVVAVGAASSRGGHGEGALFLLWWLIPVMIFRSRRHWGR